MPRFLKPREKAYCFTVSISLRQRSRRYIHGCRLGDLASDPSWMLSKTVVVVKVKRMNVVVAIDLVHASFGGVAAGATGEKPALAHNPVKFLAR